MLEGLDQITWHNLKHAYGEASDVPDLLKALASDAAEEYRETLYHLYSNIYHQGTVYEATAYAVPFLIELLQSPVVACKGEILIFLAHVAQGSSYIDVHQSLDFMYSAEERSSANFQTQLEAELLWVSQAHIAVGQGIEIYLELLKLPDAYVRTCVFYVLACFEEQSATLLPKVAAHLEQEADASVKASLIFCLGVLSQHDSPYLNLLVVLLNDREEILVKVVAAMELVFYAKDAAPAEALRLLIDVITHPGTIPRNNLGGASTMEEGGERYESYSFIAPLVGDCTSSAAADYAELPWARTNMTSDIYDLFCLLSPALAELALNTLIAEIKHADISVVAELRQYEEDLKLANEANEHQPPDMVIKMAAAMKVVGIREVQSAVRVLLHIAFGGKSIAKGSLQQSLTTTQRLVLTTIAQSEAAWIVSGNTEHTLRSFGLLQWAAPNSVRGREKLYTFLESV